MLIMKLDANKSNGTNDSEDAEHRNESRQNVDSLIDDILAEFSDTRPFNNLPNGTVSNGSNNLLETLDADLNLQDSIANKCLELQEILKTLRTRLNQVVVDTSIVLSPDGDPLDEQLAHDLDTDCQEDISLQEFLDIINTQNNKPNA